MPNSMLRVHAVIDRYLGAALYEECRGGRGTIVKFLIEEEIRDGWGSGRDSGVGRRRLENNSGNDWRRPVGEIPRQALPSNLWPSLFLHRAHFIDRRNRLRIARRHADGQRANCQKNDQSAPAETAKTFEMFQRRFHQAVMLLITQTILRGQAKLRLQR
jgi:hypothetical protein